MERERTKKLWLLVVAIGCLAAAPDTSKAGDAYQVIVHPDNRASELARGFLRDAFLRKVVEWDSGETLRPVDLSRKFPVRERFGRDVLKKTPAQLRTYWSQQIFSGKGSPPPEVDSEAAVIAYVLGNRGAVGYLAAGSDARGARVVKVR